MQWSLLLKHMSLNISSRGIFEKDIKLSEKNNNIWSNSYAEYGWPYSHLYGDTTDR